MNDEELKEALEFICKRLENHSCTWRIEGSANLRVLGMNVSVNDLDITTNDEGIDVFRTVLQDVIVKDFFSSKLNGRSLICSVAGCEVEINAYGDRETDFFDEAVVFHWHGLRFPVLPLKFALEFYTSIGRQEKIDLIQEFLNNEKKKY